MIIRVALSAGLRSRTKTISDVNHNSDQRFVNPTISFRSFRKLIGISQPPGVLWGNEGHWVEWGRISIRVVTTCTCIGP